MPKAKQVPITQAAPEPAFPIFVIKISRLLTMSRMLTHCS